MIKEAIKKLVAGNDLTFDEAAQVMDEMFSGTGGGTGSAEGKGYG